MVNKMNKKISVISMFFLIFSITGCSQGHLDFKRITDSNTASKIIGMATSHLIGIGGGRLVAIGSTYAIKGLGRYLNEHEKQQAIDAADKVLEKSSRNTVRWNSQKVRGETTASAIHNDCQKVKHTIIKNGKTYKATEDYCRDPNSGQMLKKA